jgi:threonylcarbamoyladenosine tRNA methylthiotransferase MtaB
MKIFLDSIGCRLNQSEIEKFAWQFRAAGHEVVGNAEEADLVVINTCNVTAKAASDSRQKVRQAAKVTGGEIQMTGCWATLDREAALALPRVKGVVANADKDRLVVDVLGLPAETFDLEPLMREVLPGVHHRTRAFLKVQDGCDNHCTFCITRIARGKGRSIPVAEVIADAQAAIRGGSKEIVLTGVHLGSWGQDLSPQKHLYDLIKTLLETCEFPRLRLSSLEPWDLDERFFSLWADPRMCRHLHLPLQSGCAATLRRMARNTTPDSFSRLLEMVRSVVPDVAITTDVIVGFPGESEEEFNQSLAFVRAMKFSGGHVFSYSSRPGTPAARLPGHVPAEEIRKRGAAMRAVLAEAADAYSSAHIGQEVGVLWEATQIHGPEGWHLHGLTDNNLRVKVVYPERLWNCISTVRLNGIDGDGLTGEMVNPVSYR